VQQELQFTEKNSLIGELLVNEGIITREQLNIALEKQKTVSQTGSKGLLGNTLVKLGYCKESDISRVIAKRAGVEYLEMQDYEIDMVAVNLITPELAKKYNALPISFKDGKLLIAMKNPGDIVAIDDIRIITGHAIRPVVINDRELETAIKRFENMSLTLQEPEEVKEIEEEKEDINENLNDRPAVQLTNQIINQAVKAGASDIHIEPQEKRLRIRYRIDGVLHEIMQQPIAIHPTLVSQSLPYSGTKFVLQISLNSTVSQRIFIPSWARRLRYSSG
jgi:type IV pilus assembly protein PilB